MNQTPMIVFAAAFLILLAHHLYKRREYALMLLPTFIAAMLIWDYFPQTHHLTLLVGHVLGVTGRELAPLAAALAMLAVALIGCRYIFTAPSKNR